MYRWLVARIVRWSVAKLNAGDATPLLRLAAPNAELAFPGDNSWATMFRPVERGRHRHVTHRGIDECRAFADRFVGDGIRFVIEDVLVAGWPWNTRVAVRAHNYIAGPDGQGLYANRAVLFLELRWARLVRWEDYEDTERVAADDRRRGIGAVD